jgi:hypothetical protein
MTTDSLISRIREGMDVRTADNIRLGKIVQVWIGADPANSTARCDEELCSRLQVRHRDQTRYIPYSAIGSVETKTVVLNVTAALADEHDWTRRPRWIPAAAELQTLGRTDPLRT